MARKCSEIRMNIISEGKILKYLALFFIVLMLSTAGIVLALKSPGSIKEQLYDRAVEPLLVIPPNQPDVLRIVYTGVSTPVTPHIAQQSVVISINNKNYVFDSGSRSTANFISQGTLEAAFIEAVFITHTHSDHIGSLGELVLASWGRGRTSSLPVYGAGQLTQNVVDGFNLAYKPDRDHRVNHHGKGFFIAENGLLEAKIFDSPKSEASVFKDNNIEVFAFSVPHGPIHGAVGYRIVAGNRSVIISGDTDLMDDYSFANGVDVLIHEAILEQESAEISRAAYRVGNDRMGVIFHDIQNYHANLMDYDDQPGLLSRLEGIDIGMLALIHIIPDKDQPIVKRTLRRFKSKSSHKTVVVNDNMVMELPLNSDKIFIK